MRGCSGQAGLRANECRETVEFLRLFDRMRLKLRTNPDLLFDFFPVCGEDVVYKCEKIYTRRAEDPSSATSSSELGPDGDRISPSIPIALLLVVV